MSGIQDPQVTFSHTSFPALILLQGGCAGPRTRGLQPQHLCHCRGQPQGCRQLRQGPVLTAQQQHRRRGSEPACCMAQPSFS